MPTQLSWKLNRNEIRFLQLWYIKNLKQFIHHFKYRLEQGRGVNIDFSQICKTCLSNKASGDLIAVHLFQLLCTAVIYPRQVTISDKASGDTFLSVFTSDNIARLI